MAALRNLEPLVAEFERRTGYSFEVLQVKEKLGGLSFNVNFSDDAIEERIEAAELESAVICEVCGQPGERRQRAWIRTLCNQHVGKESAIDLEK